MNGQNNPKITFKVGITNAQVKELIELTKNDAEVIRFTHDLVRFKDLDSYKLWKKGKKLFTLTGSKGELYGIIWFEAKKLPKTDFFYTFGIRTYPPIRGGGHAKKFLQEALEKFGNHRVWLSAKTTNTKAIAFYNHFGFEKFAIKNGRIFMTYTP